MSIVIIHSLSFGGGGEPRVDWGRELGLQGGVKRRYQNKPPCGWLFNMAEDHHPTCQYGPLIVYVCDW